MDMTPRQETTAVKKALIEVGFDKQVVSVGHGHGTAAAWLEILVNQTDGYDESYERAIATAQKVTGRHGDYSGQINVTVRSDVHPEARR